MKDLYKALGLNPNASTGQILARISEAGSTMLAKDAKAVLLDDQKREIYDKNYKILKEIGRIRQDLSLLGGPSWKIVDSSDFNPPTNRARRDSGYTRRDSGYTRRDSGYTRRENSPSTSTRGWFSTILVLAIQFWPITLPLTIVSCNWLGDAFNSKSEKVDKSKAPYINSSGDRSTSSGNSFTVESLDPTGQLGVVVPKDANLKELNLPQTGGGHVYFGAERLVGGFSVKTKSGSQNYLIKLEDYFTNAKKAEFFIRGGDTFGIDVPAGTYRIKMASGKKWYGMKHLFGSRTAYSKANDSFPISYGDQWTVELIPQRDGNLKDIPIGADEF